MRRSMVLLVISFLGMPLTSASAGTALSKNYKVSLVPAYGRCTTTCPTTPLSEWTFDKGTVEITKTLPGNVAYLSINLQGIRDEGGQLANGVPCFSVSVSLDITKDSNGSRSRVDYNSGPRGCSDGGVNFDLSIIVPYGDLTFEVYDLEVRDASDNENLMAVPGTRTVW